VSSSKRNLIDRDIRMKVVVSDDDVKNYFYNKYARSGAAPLSYKLQIITVTIKNFKTATAAKETIQRALDTLAHGETFEEAAKRFSDHPSAGNGGDLGQVSGDQLAPVLKEQLKSLKIGQVSSIFGGTSVGTYYLVKLVDLKTADSDVLESKKEEIRGQLATGEYQHQIQLWLDRERQKAFIHKAGEKLFK